MSPDAVERALHIATQAAMLAGAIITAMLPLLPFVLPVIRGWVRGERNRQAFDAVSRAGLLAASAASSEFRRLIAAAQAPGSPGGVAITDEEKRVVLAKATAMGVEALRRSGDLPQVTSAYGGDDAVKASVESIIHYKLYGRAVDLPNGALAQMRAMQELLQQTSEVNDSYAKVADTAVGAIREQTEVIRASTGVTEALVPPVKKPEDGGGGLQ